MRIKTAFARYTVDKIKMVLTVPAKPLQAISQQFTVSVEPPGFIHHLIQLVILVLSWTNKKTVTSDTTHFLSELFYMTHRRPDLDQRPMISLVCQHLNIAKFMQ